VRSCEMSQEEDENGVNNPVSKRRNPDDEAGSLFDNAGPDCSSSNAPNGNNPQQLGTADTNSLSTTQPTYANRMFYASRAANESISSRSNMRQQILNQLEADSRIGIGRSNSVTIPSPSSSSGWNQEARSAVIASANPINSLLNAGGVYLNSLSSSSNHLLNQHSGRAIGVPNHVNEQNKHLLVPEPSSARGGGGQASLGPDVNDRSLSSSSKKRCRLSGAPGMDLRQRINSNSITPIDMPLHATGSFTPSSTTVGFGRNSNDATLSQFRSNDEASLLLPPQQQMYQLRSPGMQQQEPSFAPALGLPQSSGGNNVSNRAFGSVANSWIPPPSQQALPSQPALQFRRPHLSPSQWPPAPGGVNAGVAPQQQQHSLELLLRSQQHRQNLGGIQHQEATNLNNRENNNNFRTNNHHDISPSYLNNMEQIANTRPVQRRRIADGSLVAASPRPSSQILYPQNVYLPSQQSHHLTGLQMPRNVGLPFANVASLSLGNPVVQHQFAQEEQTKSKKSKRKPRIFKTFQERFDKLTEYKREHGHCNVPRRYGPDKSLGVWCNNIRYSFRQLQGGKHPHNFISEEDIRRLDEIGFQWTLKSNPSSTDDAKESVEES